MCFSSFRSAKWALEEGEFFVLFPAADTLGNAVVLYGLKSTCNFLTCRRKTAEMIEYRFIIICWNATQLNEIIIMSKKITCIFRPIILPKLQHAL